MHTVNSHSLHHVDMGRQKEKNKVFMTYGRSIELYGFVWHGQSADLPSGNTCILFHFIVLIVCMAVLCYCMLWQMSVQLKSAKEGIYSVPRYKCICTAYLSLYLAKERKKNAYIQWPCLYPSCPSQILCTVLTVILNHVMKHGSMYSGASAASRWSGPTEYYIDMRVIILRNLELCNLH